VSKWFRSASGVTAAIVVLVTIVAACTTSEEPAPPIETPAEPRQDVETEAQATRSIEEVKTDWEQRLMAMRGVTGVSIGLTQESREPCIKVYVSRLAVGAAAEIPKEIEGYPVEVERRGVFRPRQ